jgi:hypothetical protein
MQTFVPTKNHNESAKLLDRMRLGKQRVETMQIMNALLNPDKGWKQHPATKMWRGHELALLRYQQAICFEWTSRGYRDTCLEKTVAIMEAFRENVDWTNDSDPDWMGNDDVHASHRSNLLRKAPDHYGQYGWLEDDTMEYVWPV